MPTTDRGVELPRSVRQARALADHRAVLRAVPVAWSGSPAGGGPVPGGGPAPGGGPLPGDGPVPGDVFALPADPAAFVGPPPGPWARAAEHARGLLLVAVTAVGLRIAIALLADAEHARSPVAVVLGAVVFGAVLGPPWRRWSRRRAELRHRARFRAAYDPDRADVRPLVGRVVTTRATRDRHGFPSDVVVLVRVRAPRSVGWSGDVVVAGVSASPRLAPDEVPRPGDPVGVWVCPSGWTLLQVPRSRGARPQVTVGGRGYH